MVPWIMTATEVFIRAALLSSFRDTVAERGISADDLLLEAGLDSGALDDPSNELPVDSVAILLELAAERANDPGLGLTLAEAFPAGATGLYGYIVLNAGTVRDCLQAMSRFAGLLFHPSPMTYREEANFATVSWYFPSRQSARRVQLASFSNALVMLRLRKITGRDWTPPFVELEHPELTCPARLQRIFGPRITFNARENLIAIDKPTLQKANKGADPRLFRILQETGESKLHELAVRPDLIGRTARAIMEVLSNDTPLLERVAEQMRMTPRSLQNRLAQQGTTFERVLSNTRRNLAERYLRDTDLPLTEIALLLGFSEQSAFTRAAKGWFGMPPRQLRKEGGGWPAMVRPGRPDQAGAHPSIHHQPPRRSQRNQSNRHPLRAGGA